MNSLRTIRFFPFAKLTAAILMAGCIALLAPLGRADDLQFFKNYFVTGDYAVAGVGLYGKAVKGSVTGSINFSGVPCTTGPGLLASVVPCTATGAVPADIIAAFLYWDAIESTSTPSSSNGVLDNNAIVGLPLGNPNTLACGTGGGTQSGSYARVYRADVLRYLAINQAASVRVANGAHTVQFNSGGTTTQFNGASLVVIYRLVTPGNPRIAPLRSVVLYDGVFTGTKSAGLNQTMGGFYQAALTPAAKMTQIVGNGQRGSNETLTVNGSIPSGVPANPLLGGQGANWDNYTFNINLAANASSVATQVVLTQSCLSWAAIITSTNVQDTDLDGLLDVWETSGLYLNPGARYDGTTTPPVAATFGTCANNLAGCLNLPAMGANPLTPDIFVQIDWMQGSYNAAHTHNPQLGALNLIGSTFKTHGINVHFDVGSSSTYQGQASPYIIPAAYTRGGNVVQESALFCKSNPPSSCAFYPDSQQYSVLGWKVGLSAIKNGNSALGLPALFALNRKDAFHYVFFGHALASTNSLSSPHPASISGVADRPGGDVLITLGLWRSNMSSVDQVGTQLVQAGTLMHELGHNLDLSHNGWYRTPNCAPNYPSVMNYLYQTRGLTDSSGDEHIDYSYGLELLPINEKLLSATLPLGLQNYKVRYFGPLGPGQQSQASALHCDGTPLNGDAPYMRLESPKVATPDWSNGTVASGTRLPPLDINYDGILGETFTDQPDWFSLNLQQVGARQNVDGLSAEVGQSDLGQSDLGQSDLGQSDLGQSDLGQSDLGQSDLGDIDYTTQLLSGVDVPPSPSTSCPTCGLTAVNSATANQLSWTAPGTGQIIFYNIYRCAVIAPATACTPSGPYLLNVPASPTLPTTYNDTVNDLVDSGATCPATSTCYNTTYTYYVTAVASVTTSSGTISAQSGPSNTATNQVTHLFVIADNQTAQYGTSLPTATAKIYGAVTGSLATSAVTCAYQSAAKYNVGNYTITCSGPAATSATDGVTYNADYLTFTPGTLTVTPAPLTANIAGSQTYGGSGRTFVASSYGPPTFVNGDNSSVVTGTLSCSTNASNGTPVGSNSTISGCSGLTASNYTISYSYGSFTVNPAPLTATVTGSQTYGGTNKTISVSNYATFVNGENSSVVSGSLSCSTNATAMSPVVGNYTISGCSGLTASNYTISYSYGTFTVNPAAAVVTLSNLTQTYTGSALMPTVTTTPSSLAVSLTGTPDVNAGGYPVMATVTDPNYTGSMSGMFVILQATAIVSFSDMTQTNTGNALSPTVTTTPPGLTYNLSGAPDTANGSYPVTATVTDSNYTGSASGTFVITQMVYFTDLALNGNAAVSGSTLRLADNQTGEASSAWLKIERPVAAGFSTSFSFVINPPSGQTLADGFAFVVQAGQGTTSVGTGGGSIGYAGIPNSLAVEFDTFYNSENNDPGTAHVGIQSNGKLANSPVHTIGTAPSLAQPVEYVFSNGATHTATITYDGATLSVFLDGSNTALVSATVNLSLLLSLDGGTNAYVGFTAATGADSETTDILSWNWN